MSPSAPPFLTLLTLCFVFVILHCLTPSPSSVFFLHHLPSSGTKPPFTESFSSLPQVLPLWSHFPSWWTFSYAWDSSRRARNKQQRIRNGNITPQLDQHLFTALGRSLCFRFRDRICLKERWVCHLIFNKTCLDENLFSRVVDNSAYSTEVPGRTILKARVKNCHHQIALLEKDIAHLRSSCKSKLTFEQWGIFATWLSDCAIDSIRTIQDHHIAKLNAIRRSYGFDPSSLPDRWVVNLSSETLSTDELNLLKLGLKFVPSPRKVNRVAYVVEFLGALDESSISSSEKVTLTEKVMRALLRSRPPLPNLTLSQRRALCQLKKRHNLFILPADKGDSTVVISRPDYESKMADLLNQEIQKGTYQELPRDPTPAMKRRVESLLRQLLETKKISASQRWKWAPRAWACPRLYGLIKVHKPGFPLRQIVAGYTSPTYRFARDLARVLRRYVVGSASMAWSTQKFCAKIKNFSVPPGYCQVSFDVTALFPSVPLDLTLKLVKDLLKSDEPYLLSELGLSADTCFRLITLHAAEDSSFVWRNRCFRQLDGVAMGSPLAPILAEIYMQHLELCLQPFFSSKDLLFYTRYVDDIFAIVREDKLDDILHTLNSQHRRIKFTFEKEKDSCLPFLDVKCERRGGSIHTSVYRKPTHTDRYFAFSSCHPAHVKKQLLNCLQTRALVVSSSKEAEDSELSHVREAVSRLGFPTDLYDSCLLSLRKKSAPVELDSALAPPSPPPASDPAPSSADPVTSTCPLCLKPCSAPYVGCDFCPACCHLECTGFSSFTTAKKTVFRCPRCRPPSLDLDSSPLLSQEAEDAAFLRQMHLEHLHLQDDWTQDPPTQVSAPPCSSPPPPKKKRPLTRSVTYAPALPFPSSSPDINLPCSSPPPPPLPNSTPLPEPESHINQEEIEEVDEQSEHDESEPREKKSKTVPLMCVPYVPGLTETLKRILAGRIQVVAKTRPLRWFFHSPKDPLKPPEKSCVLYEFTCPTCRQKYIGETRRPQSERNCNHLDDIRHHRIHCGIAAHVSSTGHPASFELLRQWPSYENDLKRRYHEALFIQVLRPDLNVNQGKPLNQGWISLCRSEIARLASTD